MHTIGYLLRMFILYGSFLALLLAPLAYLGIRSIVRESVAIHDKYQ